MNLNFIQITSAFMVLFAIIDISGNTPVIIDIRSKGQKVPALTTTLIATILLIAFLFMGEGLLKLFNIDIESFAVAGALITFIISLEMILEIEIFRNNRPSGNSTVIPVVFPLLAGPASFTTLLSLRAEYAIENIIIAVLLNMFVVFIVLKLTDKIEKIIGETGTYILRKFFGIVLLAIAVKLFTSNLKFLI